MPVTWKVTGTCLLRLCSLVGAGDEILPQLAELEQVGVQRLMLQWMDLEDLEGLEALGKVVGGM